MIFFIYSEASDIVKTGVYTHSDNSEYTSNRISLIRRLPNIDTKCVQYIGIFRSSENNLFIYVGILRRFENGYFYTL